MRNLTRLLLIAGALAAGPLAAQAPAPAPASSQAQQQAAQQQAAKVDQLALFNKGLAACLEGHGYTVK